MLFGRCTKPPKIPVASHLLDLSVLQNTYAFLTVFKKRHKRFRMTIAVWAFLKAEPAIAFDCQYQCRSLAGVAHKHVSYLTLGIFSQT
jgi:hypothetical protein